MGQFYIELPPKTGPSGDYVLKTGDTMTGKLTIGADLEALKVNFFGIQNPIIDNGTSPGSVQFITTSMTAPLSSTIANIDTIGVNTAALIDIKDHAVLTSGPFGLGLCSLALPSVVKMAGDSTVDNITGAAFAITLDQTATGGTIDSAICSRSVAVPNGSTNVNKLYGYKFDLPFGNVATKTWGVYVLPEVYNYFAGPIILGGADTPLSNDTALELNGTKVFLNARLTGAQAALLNPIEGMQYFDTDIKKLMLYDGSSWVSLN